VLGLPPRDHKEITVDANVYDGYDGSYEVSSFVITVVPDGNHLFAQMNGNKYEIFPESVRDYFFKAFDSQITFVTDANGRATELIFQEGAQICARTGSNNPPFRPRFSFWPRSKITCHPDRSEPA